MSVNKLKFMRPTRGGFAKTIRWLDENLPVCPVCATAKPVWEVNSPTFRDSLKRQFYSRCSNCEAILRIPTVMLESKMFAAATKGVAGAYEKKVRNKIVVEDAGSGDSSYVGKELTLEEIQSLVKEG